MLYTGAIFFPFLACSLVVFWALRTQAARTRLLALASTAFLLSVDRWAVLSVLTISTLVYLGGAWARKTGRSIASFAVALVPLAYLALCKYGAQLPVARQHALWPLFWPLGTSYFTFKQIHYLIESDRKALPPHSFWQFLAYMTFFPIFVAGPIERFPSFFAQSSTIAFSWGTFSEGAERILQGFLKKAIAADLILGPVLARVGAWEEWSTASVRWNAGLAVGLLRFLHTYADFSAYTDMAIGTSLLFGYRIAPNFDFPLLRTNLAEFWRSWHMSLSSWVRDYVYFPLLVRFRFAKLALAASMVTMGLWHAADAGWVLWGLHHSFGLMVLAAFHRWAAKKPRWRAVRVTWWWRGLGRVAMLWYISLAYLLNYSPAGLVGSGALALKLHLYAHVASFGLLS